MSNVCLECGKDFPSLRALHGHLKAHETCIGDYYVKNFQRRDLLTKDLLQFTNYDKYFNEDFSSYENYLNWIRTAPQQTVKEYIVKKAKTKFVEKNIRKAPPDLYYKLGKMAGVNELNVHFGNYENFLSEIGLENHFNKMLPDEFWETNCADIPIWIDTREQNPIHFHNGFFHKLDFGDYTTNGKLYSKTFIDRKAQDDFRGTFGKGIDRFKKEMDRCKDFGSYMFVVVESSINKIEEDNRSSRFKSNLEFAWHNVRELMLDYPDNIQFIFAHSREGAKKIIPKILYYGRDLWNVDLQFFLTKRINELAQRNSK